MQVNVQCYVTVLTVTDRLNRRLGLRARKETACSTLQTAKKRYIRLM